MAKKELKPLDVLMELARECKRTSQRATAKRLGFSDAFICDVLNGRREITDNLAAKMGGMCIRLGGPRRASRSRPC